ncbi:ANTAR domain-containing protein [Streptomyces sp. NPDC058122]|uniref:ANTAR domain-containing protein n=1 Tax=Streptomyces sp. NPDC058122 TaxID=3346349 RepID=UPI0036EE5086
MAELSPHGPNRDHRTEAPMAAPQHFAATRGEVVSLPARASTQEQGHVLEAVEQAVGIVMALGRLRADQARAVLEEVSQRAHITLRRIAELLTDWVSSGELNLGIRIALEESIRHQARLARSAGPVAE